MKWIRTGNGGYAPYERRRPVSRRRIHRIRQAWNRLSKQTRLTPGSVAREYWEQGQSAERQKVVAMEQVGTISHTSAAVWRFVNRLPPEPDDAELLLMLTAEPLGD